MRLGLNIGYSGKRATAPVELVRQAEAAGFDSVWVAEAYGSDAVSVASWLLARTTRIRVGTAIMQIPARTPAREALGKLLREIVSFPPKDTSDDPRKPESGNAAES